MRWAPGRRRVFDDIDAVQGESLRSVLRQLRDLHRSRFEQAVTAEGFEVLVLRA